MTGKVAEINDMLGSQDGLAEAIVELWDKWDDERDGWMAERKELRNFVFATDTSTTSVDKNGWNNKTTLPKIAQVYDNLHANYISGLMPNDDFLKWEGYSREDADIQKVKTITAYMQNKVRQSDFRAVLSRLLADYILDGNCFADVEYIREYKVDPKTGEKHALYVGPRVRRISPRDIVFNPVSDSFRNSPKIERIVTTIGELEKLARDTNNEALASAVQRHKDISSKSSHYKLEDWSKADGYLADGFGNLQEYYGSGYVELHKFRGTVYDPDSGVLYDNREILLMDGRYVVENKEIDSWLGDTYQHCGWRTRPDNLWAMGPLDNLVGMQYRIDHLENLKADVFDIIARPPLLIKGDVEDFNWGPGEEIFLGDDGSVAMLVPDVTALNADTQIAILERMMEEYAGAPRQAMGIRTPGEKTAFEVQALENAAGRIFQEKITNFEVNFLEPLMNAMLEIARREMDGPDVVRVMDNDIGVATFMTITKEDITAKGKIRPVGARHFSQRAQLLQNLSGVMNGPLGQMIAPHTSSVKLAELVEDTLTLNKYDLFSPNVALYEQGETAIVGARVQEEVAMTIGQPAPTEAQPAAQTPQE